MKILVTEQIFYPVEFKVNDICRQLVEDGHEVTVITGLPNYPTGIIPKEYKFGRNRRETWHGVNIIRCFEIPRKKGPLGMILNYFSFCISGAVCAFFLKEKFDVVLAYETSPVLMAYPGEVYAKKNNVPLLLYCLDIWPEVVKTMIPNEDSIIFKGAKYLSTKIYNRADLIAVQSKGFYEYFEKVHGICKDKLRYLPQYADSEFYELDLTAEDNGIVDFVFLGNIGIAQDIGGIIDAVDLIRDVSGFKVHLVGEGSYYETAVNKVKEKGLEDLIIFYGRRPHSEMKDFYKLADVCLATLQADSMISLTIPAKVQEYMAAGKPIIAALSGFARSIIEESGAGMVVEPGNSNELAYAMQSFLDDYADIENINIKEYYSSHFSKEIFMSSLYQLMQEFVL